MVEAINNRELNKLDQLIDPNVLRHSAATTGVTVTNLDEFKAMLQADFAAVPDSAMTIDVIFGNAEFVAMRAIYSARRPAPWGRSRQATNELSCPLSAYCGLPTARFGNVGGMG